MTLRRFTANALGVAGFLAIAVWAGVAADRWFYQTWGEWAFERDLRGEPATLGAFLEEEKLRGVRWLVGAGDPTGQLRDAKPPVRPAETSRDGVIGRLTIPRLGLSTIVRDGDGESILRVALGHIPGTALPGQDGTVGIAGHRDTLFRGLRGVRQNDLIKLETRAGTYVYRVQSTRVVNPRDTSVLQAGPLPRLTLVTCYPFRYVGAAPDRFIVQANQVSGAPDG